MCSKDASCSSSLPSSCAVQNQNWTPTDPDLPVPQNTTIHPKCFRLNGSKGELFLISDTCVVQHFFQDPTQLVFGTGMQGTIWASIEHGSTGASTCCGYEVCELTYPICVPEKPYPLPALLLPLNWAFHRLQHDWTRWLTFHHSHPFSRNERKSKHSLWQWLRWKAFPCQFPTERLGNESHLVWTTLERAPVNTTHLHSKHDHTRAIMM